MKNHNKKQGARFSPEAHQAHVGMAGSKFNGREDEMPAHDGAESVEKVARNESAPRGRNAAREGVAAKQELADEADAAKKVHDDEEETATERKAKVKAGAMKGGRDRKW